MNAIILAAGRGSRLGNLTDESPKCMLEVSGKPLLHWQRDALREAGIKNVGVVAGYKSDKLAAEDLSLFINKNWANSHMLTSLICASEWLEQEPCVVSYADIVYPAETITKLQAADGEFVISYNTEWEELWRKRFDNPLDDAESFKISQSGDLLDIGRRVSSISEIQGQFMGLLKFKPEGWRQAMSILKQSNLSADNMDMTQFIGELLKFGMKVSTVPVDGRWHEFDSEKDLSIFKGI